MSRSPLAYTATAAAALPDQAATRLYQVSRDLYAPVLAAFAAQCLDLLRGRPAARNICLARDGISAFLAQQTLLRRAPERFGGVMPSQVRLAYLSRQLVRRGRVCAATRELIYGYLNAQGLRAAPLVNLVDVGVHGSIQDILHHWYPQVELRGHYLLYRRRAKDQLASQKCGFLVGNPDAADESAFLHRPFIHLIEDLWSGVYESVTLLRCVTATIGSAAVRPTLEPLGTRSPLPLPPGDLRQLKRAALRGVVDGVAQAAHDSSLLRADVSLQADHTRRLADWITSTRSSASPDAWLWRTLIRPDRDQSEHCEE